MKTVLVCLVLSILASPSALAAVWKAETTWSPEWEKTYRTWLGERGKVDLFERATNPDGTPNPYRGIHVDCADLVYSLRAIFAYENRLPYAIANPVSSRGAPITNEATRYDSVADGAPRFRRFLAWIQELVNTHGLDRDTYSVPFERIGPGTVILTSRKNHHSWTITGVAKTGTPTLLFNSTVGRESGLRVQQRQSWPNPYWVFEPEPVEGDPTRTRDVYHPGSYAGFRYWRPAETLSAPENTVPGYSDAQFRVGVAKWALVAQRTLAEAAETIDETVSRLLGDACADFKQRVDAVAEAEAYKRHRGGGASEFEGEVDPRCMGPDTFEQFSTPSRDRRFLDGLMLARAYFVYGLKRYGTGAYPPERLARYTEFFPRPELSAAEEIRATPNEVSSAYCVQKIPGIETLSLARFKGRLFRGRASANPNDSWTARFGYAAGPSDLGSKCPAYGLDRHPPDLDASESEATAEVRAATSER